MAVLIGVNSAKNKDIPPPALWTLMITKDFNNALHLIRTFISNLGHEEIS